MLVEGSHSLYAQCPLVRIGTGSFLRSWKSFFVLYYEYGYMYMCACVCGSASNVDATICTSDKLTQNDAHFINYWM